MGNAAYYKTTTAQDSDLFVLYKFENTLEDSSIHELDLVQDGGTIEYVEGFIDWALSISDYVGGGK